MNRNSDDGPIEDGGPSKVGSDGDATDPRVARREKLRQIEAMGIDPYGSRFDDRTLIGDCHQKASEIQFKTASGDLLDLPDFDAPELDYRQWKSDNGPGDEIGEHHGAVLVRVDAV